MREEVGASPRYKFALCVEQSHHGEEARLAYNYMFGYRLHHPTTLFREHALQLYAHKARLADDMAESLFALADTQVIFPFIDGKTGFRPRHLLWILSRIPDTQFVRLNPDTGTRITVLEDQHGHQEDKANNREDVGKDNI